MSIAPHLQCMGRPVLIGSDGNPVRFRTRKHLGLVLYLALEPRRAYRREHLVELLWPAVPEHGGRHSLATALSVIRARLGRDCVTSMRDMVRFTPQALTLDLDRLAADEILGDEYTPPLEVAALLADFDIRDAPEFMIWRDRQRSRWLPHIRDALIRLIDLRRRTGAFREIETLADRLMGLDELSEEAIRAKMEARAFDGDRLTALRLYEDWSARLNAELQAAPSALVEGIATRLRRRGWERPSSAPVPPVPTDQWKNRPFVGRASEYRQIYEAWERTRDGSPQHVLLLGDSGVGKSTLLDRVATAAGLEGAAVSRVQCYELERDIPYAALSSLVRGLLDRPGAAATSPEWLAELARTVPEVRRRFPGIPASRDTQGETARVRLTEAVQQLIIALSEEQPVILVVDDLHQTDDASLAVLHLLLRRSTSLPLIALMAARPGGLGQSPQAVRFREGTARIPLLTMTLPPLSVAEAAQLLDKLLQDEPRPCSPAVRKALLAAAHGYPMVLQHLVLDWSAHGDRALALAVGAMTEDLSTDEPEVETYRALVQRVSAQLDATAQHVLMLAAVLGPRLNELRLYRLVDLTATQTLAALAELARTRVLRDGGRELEFANELFRGEAYRAIPASLRRTLHSDIADDLLRRLEQGEAIPGLEIAWHCIRSGRMNEATEHLLRGAEEAMNRGAAHEAQRALESGINLIDGDRKGRAILLLVAAYQEQAQWQMALQTLYSIKDEDVGISPDLYRVVELDCLAITERPINADSPPIIDELYVLINRSKDPVALARASFLLANVAVQGRQAVDPEPLLQAVASIPRSRLPLNDRSLLAVAEGMLHYANGNLDLCRDTLINARAVIEAEGLTNIVCYRVYTAIASLMMAMGKYADACPHLEKAHVIAQSVGNTQLNLRASANLTLCYRRLGRFETALEQQHIDLLRDLPFTIRSEAVLSNNLAVCNAMLGRMEMALKLTDWQETRVTNDFPLWLLQGWQLQRADALLLTGHTEQAHSVASAAIMESNNGLLSNMFAGKYARWLCILGSATHSGSKYIDQLRELLDRIEAFDYADQVEILSSWIVLTPRSSESLRDALRAKLAMAPAGLLAELRRFGLLSNHILGRTTPSPLKPGGMIEH